MQPHDVMRLASGGLAVLLIAATVVVGRWRSFSHPVRVVLGTTQIALATLLVIWAGLLLAQRVADPFARSTSGRRRFAMLATAVGLAIGRALARATMWLLTGTCGA